MSSVVPQRTNPPKFLVVLNAWDFKKWSRIAKIVASMFPLGTTRAIENFSTEISRAIVPFSIVPNSSSQFFGFYTAIESTLFKCIKAAPISDSNGALTFMADTLVNESQMNQETFSNIVKIACHHKILLVLITIVSEAGRDMSPRFRDYSLLSLKEWLKRGTHPNRRQWLFDKKRNQVTLTDIRVNQVSLKVSDKEKDNEKAAIAL